MRVLPSLGVKIACFSHAQNNSFSRLNQFRCLSIERQSVLHAFKNGTSEHSLPIHPPPIVRPRLKCALLPPPPLPCIVRLIIEGNTMKKGSGYMFFSHGLFVSFRKYQSASWRNRRMSKNTHSDTPQYRISRDLQISSVIGGF